MKLNIDSKEDFYELSRIASEALSYVVSKKSTHTKIIILKVNSILYNLLKFRLRRFNLKLNNKYSSLWMYNY